MARPAQFGRIYPPDEAWLATRPEETILEADLPVIDTHHHLWERPGHRYLLHEFLADVRTGHNVVATVFVECNAMYRARGPAEMRPVGQTEFVAGVAAMMLSRDTQATIREVLADLVRAARARLSGDDRQGRSCESRTLDAGAASGVTRVEASNTSRRA
jgi:predicted TIM-barrel fold metal-dependent hydrolase